MIVLDAVVVVVVVAFVFGRGVGFFCQHRVFKSFFQQIMGQACEKEAIKEPVKKPLKV